MTAPARLLLTGCMVKKPTEKNYRRVLAMGDLAPCQLLTTHYIRGTQLREPDLDPAFSAVKIKND